MSGTKILNHAMPNASDIRTAQIQALLAEDAYLQLDEKTKTWRHPNRKTDEYGEYVEILGNPSEKFRVIKDFGKEDGYKDGFQASIYRSETTGALYGAIPGTEFKREFFQDVVKSDGTIGLARHNPQINDTIRFGNELLKMAAEDGEKLNRNPEVYLTGHSLGGNDVQFAKFYFGSRITRVDVFNPQSIYDLSGSQFVSKDVQINGLFNHCISSDPLSASSSHPGKTFIYDPGQKVSSHNMDNFTPTGSNNVDVLAEGTAALERANENGDRIALRRGATHALRTTASLTAQLPARIRDAGVLFGKYDRYEGQAADRDGVPPYVPGAVVAQPENARKAELGVNPESSRTDGHQTAPENLSPKTAAHQIFASPEAFFQAVPPKPSVEQGNVPTNDFNSSNNNDMGM